MSKLIVILGILLAPFIFSCSDGSKEPIHTTIFAKNNIETKIFKALTKCTLLYTKTTKLSAVNFNVGCFEEGTNYVHVYIVVDESNNAASGADAFDSLTKFFTLTDKIAKLTQISSRSLKVRGKDVSIIVLRLENVELDEILKYPSVKDSYNNL